MSDIEQSESGGKKGKVRTKKISTHIDFAPMVDLAFLLITFFMLATTLTKPQTLELVVPAKDEKVDDKDKPKVNINKLVTIIMDEENKVYYYFGAKVDATDPDPNVIASSYGPEGIRQMLLERNKNVMVKILQLKDEKVKTEMSDTAYKTKAKAIRKDKTSPIVIIKATEKSSYKNLVDVLDEMQICNIGTYAIVDITDYDKELIAKAKQK